MKRKAKHNVATLGTIQADDQPPGNANTVRVTEVFSDKEVVPTLSC